MPVLRSSCSRPVLACLTPVLFRTSRSCCPKGLSWPGRLSRRGRARSPRFAAHLPIDRPWVEIHPPGTLEWGDVLRIDNTFYAGQSERTNAAGTEQLRQALWVMGLRRGSTAGAARAASAQRCQYAWPGAIHAERPCGFGRLGRLCRPAAVRRARRHRRTGA